MILLSAAESRELDRLTSEKYGVPSYMLMTRAGEAVARAGLKYWPDAAAAGVLVIAGKGNNGGDGLVAARALRESGIKVDVILLAGRETLRGDAARACADYQAVGGSISEAAELTIAKPPGLIIDAILGTGLNAPVRGPMATAIDSINRSGVPVLAIDISSGINADTGAVMGMGIRAARTITFGYAKYGHVSYPGAEFCGELEIADIGFAPQAIATIAPRGRIIEASDIAPLIPDRAPNSHKGTYGHVLIIAGSRGKGGAAILAARGALHAGAGLVTAAIPESVAAIVASGQAELMTEPMPDRDGHFDAEATIAALLKLIEGKSAIVVGPGLGLNDDTSHLISWLIAEAVAQDCPLLIDADGLNALALGQVSDLKAASGPVVLTPHPGEMARLLKTSTGEINADRITAARKLATMTGASVLLKGARSVMASGAGDVCINSSGNPGMATPGMGDVLSGIVGALMASGLAPFDALRTGVFIHGRSADILAKQGRFGFLAGDVAATLPRAFTEVLYENIATAG